MDLIRSGRRANPAALHERQGRGAVFHTRLDLNPRECTDDAPSLDDARDRTPGRPTRHRSRFQVRADSGYL